MVRGPMIADVTAGCSSTNASARWTSDTPASSARCLELVHGVELEGVLRQRRVVARGLPLEAARLVRSRLAAAVATGQPAARERAPRQDAEAVPLRRREHVALDLAGEDRVRRLLGHRSARGPPLGDPLGLDDLRGRERRRADVADLAGVHQVGERRQRLVDVGLRSGRCSW